MALHVATSALQANRIKFQRAACPAADALIEFPEPLTVFRRDHVVEALACQIFSPFRAENSYPRWIDLQQSTVQRHDPYALRCGFDNRPVSILALLQRKLGRSNLAVLGADLLDSPDDAVAVLREEAHGIRTEKLEIMGFAQTTPEPLQFECCSLFSFSPQQRNHLSESNHPR